MPSSVILKLTYFLVTNTLRITFVSGMVYDYQDVPEEIYVAMKTSRSKGIFFNEQITGQYQFKQVDKAKS